MDLPSQIEAILFFTGEPLKHKELAKMLNASEADIEGGIMRLRDRLSGHGIALIENGGEVMLRTAPVASDLITKIRKEALEKDLGKAGLETLAIIVYQGPVTRARIDYIRGVNSAFIVRQLMVRGLVERVDNPADARSFLYKPTMELLSFLGLSSVSDLPDMQAIKDELASFESQGDATLTPSNATTEPSHSAGPGDAPTDEAAS
jgi:segregation and condensation protein B